LRVKEKSGAIVKPKRIRASGREGAKREMKGPNKMTEPRFLQKFLVLISLWLFAACASHPPQVGNLPVAQNAPDQLNQPYVILISIDGYRADYTELFHPPTLEKLGQTGLHAKGLIPVYPSKTFPNHYSIITGLYADHHGIVSNDFYDAGFDKIYKVGQHETEEGRWYGGDPLWLVVQKHGLLAASFFWVGSEADIQKSHPAQYFRYNDSVPNVDRVKQALDWLKLPEKTRPHFITLYFSDVDSQAHKHGAASKEVGQAVLEIDRVIGNLFKGLPELKLPVNVIVVSDHGMDTLDNTKAEYLDDAADMKPFLVLGRGPQALLYLKPGERRGLIAETQKKLRAKARHYRVYKRSEIPEALHYKDSPRIGDLLVEVDEPYAVGLRSDHKPFAGGNHGWNPYVNEKMRGIFYADGPAFREPQEVPAFQNINIYPLILNIFGFEPLHPIDGSLAPVAGFLKAAQAK
jgi:predicted AlkP superfamily pyrophosphatase or phosphodiesterase